MNLPKILFIVDVRDWAYDHRAQKWKRLLSKEYDIDILYLADFPVHPKRKNGNVFDHSKYDGLVFFYHKSMYSNRLHYTKFPPGKCAICINNDKWRDIGAKKTYNKWLKPAKIVVACNQRIQDEFSEVAPLVMRASQCVDDSIFKYNRSNLINPKHTGRDFVVGWSGNFSNPLKNIRMLKNACRALGVCLTVQKELTLRELSAWYNVLDLVVCPSISEGGPSLVLEAGACAIPVISTDVGLVPEIITHMDNGIITERRTGSLANYIKLVSEDLKLRMRIASKIHYEIKKNWTYKARLYEIRNVLRNLVE